MEDKMQWFVVNVHTGCEDKVARGLREQIDKRRLNAYFGEILVPTREITEIKAGKRVKLNNLSDFPIEEVENYNMIYRLDAMEAYNKRLVKKIRVTGITQNGTSSTDSYIYFIGINLSSGNPTATIEFNFNTVTGTKKITRTVNEGYNLYDNSNGREEYKNNFIITRIDGRDNSLEFMNGVKLFAGEVTGKENEDNIRAIQIRETIKAHLERERQLFYKGIKVLSLFFIDEVANYRVYGKGNDYRNGKYADMFETIYDEVVENV